MRPELRVLLVDTPVEHHCRAGVPLALEPLGRAVVGQEVAVDVGQVGIGDHNVGPYLPPVGQGDASGPPAIHVDLLHGSVVHKLDPASFRNARQRVDEVGHAAHRKPDTPGQFGILQQRIGGRSLVGAEAQVHVLEGEGGFQPTIVEVNSCLRCRNAWPAA